MREPKMKRLIAVLATALALTSIAQTNAPMDNFTLVTNLWYNGYKTNVLAIAEQRLATNSNDLPGLALMMEYDLEFANYTCLSNDIRRILSIANTVTNKTIQANYPEMKDMLEGFLDFLKSNYRPTAAELEEERAKANIIHTPMSNARYLKWLHDDGLF